MAWAAAMNECSACHVDYYYNPETKVFFSTVCDHRMCEPCITRLFQNGRAYPCPACGANVRAEDFSREPREAKRVDSEVQIRRQICDIFCKSKDDFLEEAAYHEYLAAREDIVFRLVNPSSEAEVQDTWREIEQYREQNAEQILRVQRLQPRQKFQKIMKIIEDEGIFCSGVNKEWSLSPAKGLSHPFQERYRTFLNIPPEDEEEARRAAEMSPFIPQPLSGGGEHGPADKTRQMSGGGQAPDSSVKKARQFFFSDLRSASRVVPAAAAR